MGTLGRKHLSCAACAPGPGSRRAFLLHERVAASRSRARGARGQGTRGVRTALAGRTETGGAREPSERARGCGTGVGVGRWALRAEHVCLQNAPQHCRRSQQQRGL